MTSVRLEGLSTEGEVTAAGRSALYGWLATAFFFPTPELARLLASGQLVRELESIAPALPFTLPEDDALVGGTGTPEQLEGEYIRLFEVGPGSPPCPLYEGFHRRSRQEVLEELVRFYGHFGLRHEERDMPDHVCCELEFMHYLAFKQAAALHAGSDAEPYRLAQRDFLARHLNRWLPHVRARLEELHPPPLYQALARLGEDVCRRDAAYLSAGGA